MPLIFNVILLDSDLLKKILSFTKILLIKFNDIKYIIIAKKFLKRITFF